MRIILLLIFFTGYMGGARAQSAVFKPGYLIKSNGDTLRGYIRPTAVRQLTHEIQFKLNLKDKKAQIFTPGQVTAAYVQTQENKKWQERSLSRYRAKLLQNKWLTEAAVRNLKINPDIYLVASKIQQDSVQNSVFLRQIITGPLTLYSGKAKGSFANYYLQATDSAVYPLRPRSYLGMLKVLMPGCAEIDASNITALKRHAELRLEPLTALAAAYNACTDPTSELQIRQAPVPVRFAYGVKAGMVSSKVYYSGFISEQVDKTNRYPEEYTVKQGFTGGVFVNIGQGGAFSLQPELLYTVKGGRVTKEVYEGEYYRDFYHDYDQADFTLHYVQLPVMAQLAGRIGQVRPYAGLGFILGKTIYQQQTRTLARNYTTEPNRNTVQEKQNFTFDGFEYGGAATAGIKYPFQEKEAFVELRLEKTRIPRNLVNSNLVNASFQVTAGLTIF